MSSVSLPTLAATKELEQLRVNDFTGDKNDEEQCNKLLHPRISLFHLSLYLVLFVNAGFVSLLQLQRERVCLRLLSVSLKVS